MHKQEVTIRYSNLGHSKISLYSHLHTYLPTYISLHFLSCLHYSSVSFFLHKGSLHIAAQNSALSYQFRNCSGCLCLSHQISLSVMPSPLANTNINHSCLQKKNHLFYCILHQLSSIYLGKPFRDLYTPCLHLISCHCLPFRVLCLPLSGAVLNVIYELHFSKLSI